MANGLSESFGQNCRIPSEGELAQFGTNTLKAAGVNSAVNADSLDLGVGFAVGSGLVFEGVPLALYLKRNAKINHELTKDMVNISNSTQTALKNIKNGNGSFLHRVGQYFDVINKNNMAYMSVRDVASGKANLKERLEAANKAKNALNEGSGILGWKKLRSKIQNWRYNSTLKDSKKTIDIAKATSENVSAMKRMSNMFKASGAVFMIGLSGIMEGIFEVYPTFKELGSEKGMKQLGKSAAKVASDTIGFIAGQQAGMAIGSAIGTALFPGVGTAIGAITGIIVGSIGATVADKITEKIIGKSELELAKEQQEQNNFSAVV